MPIIRNARFQQRRNTTEYWRTHPQFVPLSGEIIIYTDRRVKDNKLLPGIKIGDGTTPIVDIPFLLGESDADSVMEEIQEHIDNASIHVSQEDRAMWNGKLNYRMEGETLVFTQD